MDKPASEKWSKKLITPLIILVTDQVIVTFLILLSLCFQILDFFGTPEKLTSNKIIQTKTTSGINMFTTPV